LSVCDRNKVIMSTFVSIRYAPTLMKLPQPVSLSGKVHLQDGDPIPFALLWEKWPFAIAHIIAEAPHILSARDLLKAGCPIPKLKCAGYTRSELLYIYSMSYAHLRSFKGQHSRAISGVISISKSGIASSCDDGKIRVWGNCAAYECGSTYERNAHSCEIGCLISLNGSRIASGDLGGCIKIWDVNTMNCELSIENAHSGSIRSIVKLNGGRIASSGDNLLSHSSHHIKVWNIETGHCEQVFDGHCGSVYCILQMTCGSIALAGIDGNITIWKSVSSTRALLRSNTGSGAVGDAANSTQAVVEVNTNMHDKGYTEVKALYGHKSTIRALAQLRNGHIASGSDDNTIRIWDVSPKAASSRECLMVLRGHSSMVVCLCVLGDGETLASGSWDHTVRIWNCESGDCVRVLEGHISGVQSVALLTDGVTIVSASRDKTLRVWTC
jgi:WD40 repeat protein